MLVGDENFNACNGFEAFGHEEMMRYEQFSVTNSESVIIVFCTWSYNLGYYKGLTPLRVKSSWV